MSTPNLYAVGMGKWVEVRESPTPLQSVTTNLKVKKGRSKVDLPFTTVPGGSHVKTFLINTFYNRVGLIVNANQVLPLTPGQVKALKLAPVN